MKSYPKIRKTIKWGGVVVVVIALALWAASMKWFFGWNDYQGNSAYFGGGGFTGVHINGARPVLHWSCGQGDYSLSQGGWFLPKVYDLKGAWAVTLPLWTLVGAAALVLIAAWRLDVLARRRSLLNVCPKCSYDRTGLATGSPCPECGPPVKRG